MLPPYEDTCKFGWWRVGVGEDDDGMASNGWPASWTTWFVQILFIIIGQSSVDVWLCGCVAVSCVDPILAYSYSVLHELRDFDSKFEFLRGSGTKDILSGVKT